MSHLFRILNPSGPDPELSGVCCFAVMAKAPRPGKVKTRLSPPLTQEQASALNACFLRDTVQSLEDASRALPARWIISYTPAGEEDAFRGILPGGALLLPQRGDGFGERLLFTAEDLFACGCSAVCLIDSDSPTVPTAEYVKAAQTLFDQPARVVLGPSEDGGYYLIGLQYPHPQLFAEINWSTSVVARQTLERAAQIALPVELLETWYDVDDGSSLRRLQSEMLDPRSRYPRGYRADHTRAYLAGLPVFAEPVTLEMERSS